MKALLKVITLFCLILVTVSCHKKNTKGQAQIDDDKIQAYIRDNKLNATATGSGLYYVINTQGTGVNPGLNNTVTVKYNGHLDNGEIFDLSTSAGATFPLKNVIQGWQEGIPYFKKGGKGILLIPSALGYGSQPQTGIPANSVLVFDIELLNVQ
jgi:FKBP-type peptidyl-prolyl cis-trans isomerase FkpA